MNLVTAPSRSALLAGADNVAIKNWLFSGLDIKCFSEKVLICAHPYPSLEEKEEDHYFLAQVEEKLFPAFTSCLSAVHQVSYDSRSWKILLGHWFRRVLNLVYCSQKEVNFCCNQFNIKSFTSCDYYVTLAAFDTESCYQAMYDPFWKHTFYSRLVELSRPNLKKVNFQSCQPIKSYLKPRKHKTSSIKSIYARLARKISSNNRVAIIHPYMPFIEEVKLNLRFHQLPLAGVCNQHHALPSNTPDVKLRKHLFDEIHKSYSIDHSHFLFVHLLVDCLPTCYLEGFQQLLSVSNSFLFPRNPGIIFTSNVFDTDEGCKVWIVNQLHKNAKYIVGQHGSNYGTIRWRSHNPSIEEETSDLFLTWGWSLPNRPNTKPICNLKTINKRIKFDRAGGLLLVQHGPRPPSESTSNIEVLFSRFLDEQFSFIGGLERRIFRQTVVRLMRNNLMIKSYIRSRWKRQFENLDIDFAESSILHQINKSRIVVFAYDSTGFLEMLNLDIPVIAFWQNKYDDKICEVRSLYRSLESVGVVHTSPLSAAQHVNKVWDNVNEWWDSQKVVDARLEFVNEFSRSVPNASSKIHSLFLHALGHDSL